MGVRETDDSPIRWPLDRSPAFAIRSSRGRRNGPHQLRRRASRARDPEGHQRACEAVRPDDAPVHDTERSAPAGPPPFNAQLARRAYMTPQAISEVIEALERKGLIERTTHPNNRRVYPAVLTPQGRKVLASCDTAVDALEETMLLDLDARQRAALADSLTTACGRSARACPSRSVSRLRTCRPSRRSPPRADPAGPRHAGPIRPSRLRSPGAGRAGRTT